MKISPSYGFDLRLQRNLDWRTILDDNLTAAIMWVWSFALSNLKCFADTDLVANWAPFKWKPHGHMWSSHLKRINLLRLAHPSRLADTFVGSPGHICCLPSRVADCFNFNKSLDIWDHRRHHHNHVNRPHYNENYYPGANCEDVAPHVAGNALLGDSSPLPHPPGLSHQNPLKARSNWKSSRNLLVIIFHVANAAQPVQVVAEISSDLVVSTTKGKIQGFDTSTSHGRFAFTSLDIKNQN